MAAQRVIEILLAPQLYMLQRPRHIHHAVGRYIHTQRAADPPKKHQIVRQLAAVILIRSIRWSQENTFYRRILRHLILVFLQKQKQSLSLSHPLRLDTRAFDHVLYRGVIQHLDIILILKDHAQRILHCFKRQLVAIKRDQSRCPV